MKKRAKAILSILVLSLFAVSSKVYAVGGVNIPNPSRIDSLEELINALTSLIRPIFIVTFLAMILYGAFVYITAREDEAKVKNARSIIIAAIVGFVIAVFAPAIVDLVLNFLGVPGLSIT